MRTSQAEILMVFASEKIGNSLIEKPRAFSSEKEGNKSN